MKKIQKMKHGLILEGVEVATNLKIYLQTVKKTLKIFFLIKLLKKIVFLRLKIIIFIYL